MAATTIGLNNLTFGTDAEASSVVRSYEESIKCDPVELLNGDGAFQAVVFANPNFSANITLVNSTTNPSVGSAFGLTANSQLTGVSGNLYIDSASRTITNDGFTEVQISASGWNNLGQAS